MTTREPSRSSCCATLGRGPTRAHRQSVIIASNRTHPIMAHTKTYPKLHNATWPGVVGKGSPGAEPFIDLDTMIDLTTKAEVNGVKFDGIDVFLHAPHVDIDAGDDDLKRLADKVRTKNLVIGSVVAPVWGGTGGGSAMGGDVERTNFLTQV